MTITLRKARNAARDKRRDRRDVSREQTLTWRTMTAFGPAGRLSRWTPRLRRPPRPSCSTRPWSGGWQALADSELREIALWRLEGYTNREIADRLDCTERSVERRLDEFAASGRRTTTAIRLG